MYLNNQFSTMVKNTLSLWILGTACIHAQAATVIKETPYQYETSGEVYTDAHGACRTRQANHKVELTADETCADLNDYTQYTTPVAQSRIAYCISQATSQIPENIDYEIITTKQQKSINYVVSVFKLCAKIEKLKEDIATLPEGKKKTRLTAALTKSMNTFAEKKQVAEIHAQRIAGIIEKEDQIPVIMLTTSLTLEQKQQALDFHNDLRAQVANGHLNGAPTAADMHELIWDEELALVAENYVNQGIWGHNSARHTQYTAISGKNIQLGENISISTSTLRSFSLLDYLNRWFDESATFQYDAQSNYSNYNFTQMIWAKTQKVGCAIAYKPEGFVNASNMRTMLVCNYAVSGNYTGQKVYSSGDPATQCPSGLASTKTGLCAPEDLSSGDGLGRSIQ